MGNIASINFKKSTEWQIEHNVDKRPKYAIGKKDDGRDGVEYNTTPEFAKSLRNAMITNAMEAYKTKFKQTNQAKSYLWSAVVNLKESSTMQDLENLTAHINKKYGFQCYQIAIHRDEGHIDRDSGKKIMNYHAHLEFVTLDKETGKNRQRDLRGKEMSELQSEVAQILGMERGAEHYKAKQVAKSQGKKYKIPKRIEPRAYAVIKEREKDFITLKQKAELIAKERDNMKQERDNISQDYHRLNALRKQDFETIEQMQKEIDELRKEREARKKAENERDELLKENAELRQELESSSQNQIDIGAVREWLETPLNAEQAQNDFLKSGQFVDEIQLKLHSKNNAIWTDYKFMPQETDIIVPNLENQGYLVAVLHDKSQGDEPRRMFGSLKIAFAKTSEALQNVIKMLVNMNYKSIYKSQGYNPPKNTQNHFQSLKNTYQR